MEQEYANILWVIKYCIKILYPKFNFYIFMAFLAIKFRYYQNRNINRKRRNMFNLKSRPDNILKSILKEHVSDNYLQILGQKCIIIPKDEFIDLCVENFFYVDNGVLWVTLSLTSEEKERHKTDNNIDKFLKFNLGTSELHKKLWSGFIESIDNVRIVSVVGSKLIEENTAYTSESELHNIKASFGLKNTDNFEIAFHPMHTFEMSPKIAAVAEVNLIVNDYNLDNDFVKEVLNNYFEKPKLVSVNDIISIDLTPEVTVKYHYKYLDLIESSGKVVFKCSKLSCKNTDENTQANVIRTFYIVKGVTQLTLGDNTHSVRPKNEYYSLPGNSSVSITHACPLGLKRIFNEIQETVQPFLTGDINTLSDAMSSPILPLLLLTGAIGSGRHLLVKTLAKCNGLNCVPIDCNALQSSTAKQTESKIYALIQKAKEAAPTLVLLDNFEIFAVDPENNEDQRVIEYFMNSITDLYQNYTKHSIIFIALTENRDLKPNIMRLFLEKFHIPKLSVHQRNEILQWFTSIMDINIDNIDNKELNTDQKIVTTDSIDNLSLHSKEVLLRVASKTETFRYGNLDTLMHFAIRESYLKQVNNYLQLPQDPNLHIIHEEDFNNALESIRSLQSQHLDAPKIQKVYWEDIGGLEKLKKELLKTIEFPIKFPHLFKNSSLKRSGILLYGPPGCGKTLVAKAVSTELNVSFMSVKGPELLNMYIGQSEENVRKVFESARASSPCIVFLDELDALAPRRGSAGDSGGASDRVVSQLLAEVDGVISDADADTSSFVFIMGATNRPDLLEQSLLRPGRLDKLIYVGPYCGQQEKTSVLKALCRSYNLRPEVDLEKVAAALPDRCTGADLLQIVSTARSAAIRSLVAKLNSGLIKESDLSADSVILGVSELWQGVESFRPSVTEEELHYYESLQNIM
ncbi:peroxisomal biogenesis factor 6 [Zerene cesonia]|uniref:peroxisomal biogenesis factor 6 n=1 Tax=Zerene cesonia TaxID=33412 RepID=UPI0018E52713|nr:peroxisomal biogenesis factor 6 [Zerene cesonia]